MTVLRLVLLISFVALAAKGQQNSPQQLKGSTSCSCPGSSILDLSLRELNEFFELTGEAKWRAFNMSEMPKEVVATLEAV